MLLLLPVYRLALSLAAALGVNFGQQLTMAKLKSKFVKEFYFI